MIDAIAGLVKKFAAPLYQKVPVVRELLLLRQQLNDVMGVARRLESATITSAIAAILASDPRYGDDKRLLRHGAQYCSQNLEDGMLEEIIRRIGSVGSNFVEIGVGDGSENNTAALLLKGWTGFWIEGNTHSLSLSLKRLPQLGKQVKLISAFVSAETVKQVFEDARIPADVDVFSLDIDRDTYHVWSAMDFFHPRVVVIEYNAGIPPSAEWVCPFSPGTSWDGSQCFGASLKSLELLGRRLGYSLVGCDLTGINAFFVRNDLLADHFAEPFTAENHYEPPRYGLSYRWGHRACLFDAKPSQ